MSTMADRCERFFLFSSESERSDDSSGGPEWKYFAPAPAVYAVPAPAVDLAPAPAVYAVPAPVVDDLGQQMQFLSWSTSRRHL